jgi:hypothetical protein
MRDLLIIVGMCAMAVLIGAWLYLYGPTGVPGQVPSPSTQQASADTVVAAPEKVAFTVLAHGSRAPGVETRKNYAVFSSEDFATIWKKTGSTAKMPTVDFTKYYVISMFAGGKPRSGFGISVSDIVDHEGTRMVAAQIEAPGAGCVTTASGSSPYQIIRVPISDKSLDHTDTQSTVDCKK